MFVSNARQPKAHATICDLPQELLYIIPSHLKGEYWLRHHRCCMCRCLHAACLGLINVYDPDSPRLFVAFVKNNPRVARSTVDLRLSGLDFHPQTIINAAFVAGLLEKLPSLRKLMLGDVRIDSVKAADADASAPSLPNPPPDDRRFVLIDSTSPVISTRSLSYQRSFVSHPRSMLESSTLTSPTVRCPVDASTA